MLSSPSHTDLAFHGGRLRAAAAHFSVPQAQWLDLSTGISPWAYPLPELAPEIWQRLPEAEDLATLEAEAAQAFGLQDKASILAVPGSDSAIRLIASLFPQQKATLVDPIYSGHRTAWPHAPSWLHDAGSTVPESDFLVLANPNNPDGRRLSPDALHSLAAQSHARLIVDEAFADAHPETSLIAEQDNAIILRSFGKFYGLAGVRLGFVIADHPTISALRTLLGDWPLSGPAIAIGLKAYQDSDWQRQQRQRLINTSARLAALLQRHRLTLVGGTAYFHLVTHRRAQSLFTHLGNAGILVRLFTHQPQWLRIGLPTDDASFARLDRTLAQWSFCHDD